MRLLVVEDDVELGSQLEQGLCEQGFSVDRAPGARTGLQRTLAGTYDLILLERVLGDGDGLELMLRAREAGVDAPVIFLSAKSEIADRVDALDAGADDYVLKPFSLAELLSRVRAVLRCSGQRRPAVLQVDDLRLDPFEQTVERGDRKIELTVKEFRLLKYLLQHVSRVVTRAMILKEAWGMSADGVTNIVDVNIKRLRNKVDRGSKRPLIHTLRGVGYAIRFDAPGSEVAAAPTEPANRIGP